VRRSRVAATLLREHTATEPNLDDQVEARFGRCAYFLIVDKKKEAEKCHGLIRRCAMAAAFVRRVTYVFY